MLLFFLFFLFVGCAGLLSYVLRLKDKKWQSWPFLSQWPGWPTLPWDPELLNEAKTPKNIYREVSKIIAPDAEVALVDKRRAFTRPQTPFHVS